MFACERWSKKRQRAQERIRSNSFSLRYISKWKTKGLWQPNVVSARVCMCACVFPIHGNPQWPFFVDCPYDGRGRNRQIYHAHTHKRRFDRIPKIYKFWIETNKWIWNVIPDSLLSGIWRENQIRINNKIEISTLGRTIRVSMAHYEDPSQRCVEEWLKNGVFLFVFRDTIGKRPIFSHSATYFSEASSKWAIDSAMPTPLIYI